MARSSERAIYLANSDSPLTKTVPYTIGASVPG